jgi:hypothetical protein
MDLHQNEGNVSSGLLISKNKSYDVIHFISMSDKISTAESLEIKTDAIAFPLIEEKIRLWFFRLFENTLRPLRELFHATSATKTQRSPRFLTIIKSSRHQK